VCVCVCVCVCVRVIYYSYLRVTTLHRRKFQILGEIGFHKEKFIRNSLQLSEIKQMKRIFNRSFS